MRRGTKKCILLLLAILLLCLLAWRLTPHTFEEMTASDRDEITSLAGEPIKVFNEGKMRRDFTYIDDIIEGVMRVMARIPQPDPAWDSAKPNPSTSTAPWRIYNIGNNNTVELGTFISTLEDALGKKAIRNLMPMQPGDVEATWADVSDLIADTGFRPRTSVEYGVGQFVKWYKEYYGA